MPDSADSIPPMWWSPKYRRFYATAPVPLSIEPETRFMPSDIVELRAAAPVAEDPAAARDRIEEIVHRIDRSAGVAMQRWAAEDLRQTAADLRALTSGPRRGGVTT